MSPSTQVRPRLEIIFSLELALSLLVMAIAWTAVTLSTEPALLKARFSEVWLMATPARYELMEQTVLEAPAAGEERNLSRYVSSRRIEGTQAILAGNVGRPYEVRYRVDIAAEGAVAHWVCSGTTLSKPFAPRACRP